MRALLCCAVLLTPTSCDREVGGGIDDLLVVVSPPAGWSLDYPTYSPDGKRLIAMAFDSHADLRLMLLRDDRLEPLDMARDLVDYAWMPDSRSLLLATGKPMGPSVLQVVDLAGRLQSRVDLGTDIILAQSGMSVSADGRFAFVSALADRGLDERDLFRVDLEIRENRGPHHDIRHRRILPCRPRGWRGHLRRNQRRSARFRGAVIHGVGRSPKCRLKSCGSIRSPETPFGFWLHRGVPTGTVACLAVRTPRPLVGRDPGH